MTCNMKKKLWTVNWNLGSNVWLRMSLTPVIFSVIHIRVLSSCSSILGGDLKPSTMHSLWKIGFPNNVDGIKGGPSPSLVTTANNKYTKEQYYYLNNN